MTVPVTARPRAGRGAASKEPATNGAAVKEAPGQRATARPAIAKPVTARPGAGKGRAGRGAASPGERTAAPRPATVAAPDSPAAGVASLAAHRMPFLLLVCGLLGGALICALVISTTLAEGSFQISQLQQQDNTLAKQQQLLAAQVASARSAQVIEQLALQLGMRTPGLVQFVDLRDGKIKTDAGSGAGSSAQVPGYTP